MTAPIAKNSDEPPLNLSPEQPASSINAMNSDAMEQTMRKSTEKSQADKFKEAARRLETDDDEERFEERLKNLVKKKPKEGDKDE
jgi:hypothetical protein